MPKPRKDSVKLSDVLTGARKIFTMPNAQVHVRHLGKEVVIEMHSATGGGSETLRLPASLFQRTKEHLDHGVELFSHWILKGKHVVVLSVDAQEVTALPGDGGPGKHVMTVDFFLTKARKAKPGEIGQGLLPVFLEFQSGAAGRRLLFGYTDSSDQSRFFLLKNLSMTFQMATTRTPGNKTPFRITLRKAPEIVEARAGSRVIEGYWMQLKSSQDLIPLERCHSSMGSDLLDMLSNSIHPEWLDIKKIISPRTGPTPWKS